MFLANTRSADGFEAAFAVNHLAHFLLLRLLLPRLAHGAVVILTTSSTHDPAEKTIVAPPLHADARLLAYPERDPDRQRRQFIAGQRAYSSSKLCNLLTARALAAHPDSTARRLDAIAYDPGHTPGTDLVRNEHFAIKFLWKSLSAARTPLKPQANVCQTRTWPDPATVRQNLRCVTQRNHYLAGTFGTGAQR
jgi:NAD(P)-dependent dehydrogenase (short-subunit alcohol dehydrogenase family)